MQRVSGKTKLMRTMNTPPVTGPIPAKATKIIPLRRSMSNFDKELMGLNHDWAPRDGITDLGDPTVGLHHAHPCIDSPVSMFGPCHVEYGEIGLDESWWRLDRWPLKKLIGPSRLLAAKCGVIIPSSDKSGQNQWSRRGCSTDLRSPELGITVDGCFRKIGFRRNLQVLWSRTKPDQGLFSL